MKRTLWIALAAFLAALPVGAEEHGAARIGDDLFLAGGTVTQSETGIDDVFAAGNRLSLTAAITGSAYLAGRKVEISAPAAGDVFAAGMEVTVTADVGGDLSIAGYDVRSDRAVGGDLRASGANLTVSGPVSGYASLAADALTVDAVISGDAHLAGGEVTFGPTARVEGMVTVYEEVAGRIEVPDRVAPAERITRVLVEDGGAGGIPSAFRPPTWQRLLANFLGGVLFIAVVAALIAALLPGPLAALRRQILASPLRSVWFGFLALSVLAGAGIVLAITLIGLVITPAAILAAFVAGFVGYVIGTYALGVGLVMAVGRPEPASLGTRALAAGIGALAAGLVALIPLVGWLFVLAVTLAGIGALTLRWLRPAFFAAEPA